MIDPMTLGHYKDSNLNNAGMIDHKDVVISSLKKERLNWRTWKPILRLNDEVASIESEYLFLLDERERTENERRLFIFTSESKLTSIQQLLITSNHLWVYKDEKFHYPI